MASESPSSFLKATRQLLDTMPAYPPLQAMLMPSHLSAWEGSDGVCCAWSGQHMFCFCSSYIRLCWQGPS